MECLMFQDADFTAMNDWNAHIQYKDVQDMKCNISPIEHLRKLLYNSPVFTKMHISDPYFGKSIANLLWIPKWADLSAQ